MNQKTKRQFTYWLSIAVIGIALGFALQFVRAWTEPTSAPPGGNLGAPINTGGAAQTKAGNLNVNGGMLIGSSTIGGNKGAGTVNADQVCIRGVCQTTWPSGSTNTTNTTTTTSSSPSCAGCECNSTYSEVGGQSCVSVGEVCTITTYYMCTASGWQTTGTSTSCYSGGAGVCGAS